MGLCPHEGEMEARVEGEMEARVEGEEPSQDGRDRQRTLTLL